MTASVSSSEISNISAGTVTVENFRKTGNNFTSGDGSAGSESLHGKVDAWNPFEDQPFSQMSEDLIYDAEFDKIRQRGSQGSKLFWVK